MRKLPVIETERLVVRPFTMDDLDGLVSILAGPDEDLKEARSRQEKYLRWSVLNYEMLAALYQPPYGDRAVCLKDGELVGAVGVVPYVDDFGWLPYFRGQGGGGAQAEVGLFWTIATAHRNKGYATEAAGGLIRHLFEEEHLGHVIASTGFDNAASRAVMEKLGMAVTENPAEEPGELQVVGVLENPGA